MKFTNLTSAATFLRNHPNMKQIHVNGFDRDVHNTITWNDSPTFGNFTVLCLTRFDPRMRQEIIRGYILFQ